MPAGIAIFVKTPGLSAVKTRLAQHLGQAAAERWYGLAATAVAEVCARASDRAGAPLYWAVAEAHALSERCWTGFPRLAQGAGDLGLRMARIHGLLVEQHGGGVLLGADTPQIDAADIETALAWIAHPNPRAVFGPALDGGFWLYAGNRKLAPARWQAPAYSSPRALADLRDAHPPATEIRLLGTHCDVDTEADLEPCRAALAALPDPTPAQRRLLALMEGTKPPR